MAWLPKHALKRTEVGRADLSKQPHLAADFLIFPSIPCRFASTQPRAISLFFLPTSASRYSQSSDRHRHLFRFCWQVRSHPAASTVFPWRADFYKVSPNNERARLPPTTFRPCSRLFSTLLPTTVSILLSTRPSSLPTFFPRPSSFLLRLFGPLLDLFSTLLGFSSRLLLFDSPDNSLDSPFDPPSYLPLETLDPAKFPPGHLSPTFVLPYLLNPSHSEVAMAYLPPEM